MVAAAAVILCASAAFEARLAPLYPLPMVYDDEPLALEITASESTAAALRVIVTDPAGSKQVFDRNDLLVRAGAPRWLSIHIAGDTIGPFTAQVFAGETPIGGPIEFARVPRDAPPPNDLFFACAASVDERLAQALYYMGIRRVLVNTMEAGESEGKFNAEGECVEIQVERGGTLRAESGGDSDLAAPAKAKVEFLSPEHDLATAALESDTLFIVSAGDLAQYRAKLEAAGIERPNLVRLLATGDRMDASIVSELVLNAPLREGRDGVVLDGLMDRPSFTSVLSAFRAASVRLRNARCVGETSVNKEVIAPLFCEGPDHWLLVLAGSGPISLEITGAGIEGAWDAWNNPIGLADGGEGRVTVPLSAGLAYVRGTGGGRVREAAQAALRDEVEGLLALPEAKEMLAKDFATAISLMAGEADTEARRFTFFAALQRFPDIEERLYSGQLDTAKAIPFLAALARIVRAACALEQHVGAPFLEPVAETLARCKDYQTAYLGNATTGDWPRGDWIHAESDRLMGEARALADDGFEIEAAGVAAIAEWRARALQLAAQKQ